MGYENTLCPECGGVWQFKVIGSCEGFFCNDCDWSIITTREDISDPVTYCLIIKEGNKLNISTIRLFSTIFGLNYIGVRSAMNNDPSILRFESRATKMIEIKRKMDELAINYSIIPDFKYK